MRFWSQVAEPSNTSGCKLARAAYIAAVHPAGPDPMITTFSAITLLRVQDAHYQGQSGHTLVASCNVVPSCNCSVPSYARSSPVSPLSQKRMSILQFSD